MSPMRNGTELLSEMVAGFSISLNIPSAVPECIERAQTLPVRAVLLAHTPLELFDRILPVRFHPSILSFRVQ